MTDQIKKSTPEEIYYRIGTTYDNINKYSDKEVEYVFRNNILKYEHWFGELTDGFFAIYVVSGNIFVSIAETESKLPENLYYIARVEALLKKSEEAKGLDMDILENVNSIKFFICLMSLNSERPSVIVSNINIRKIFDFLNWKYDDKLEVNEFLT